MEEFTYRGFFRAKIFFYFGHIFQNRIIKEKKTCRFLMKKKELAEHFGHSGVFEVVKK